MYNKRCLHIEKLSANTYGRTTDGPTEKGEKNERSFLFHAASFSITFIA